MASDDLQRLLATARQGISRFLDDARREGRIDEQQYRQAAENTFPALEHWLTTSRYAEICPSLHEGLRRTIEAGNWDQLVNAYRQSCRFGTGGIRGMMAFDRESIRRLQEEGFSAPILRGPNTINEIVLLRTSAGVAKFGLGQDPPFAKVVIGYDSRVRGQDFAKIVAQLFLAYGYTVYLFDEPCPYPEVTYAIPSELVKADIGILLSASHNDYRYNGYKLSCSNGSQFDPEQRDEMYKQYIANVVPADIKLTPFDKAPREKLVFLGGDGPAPGVNYHGREDQILNIHERHVNHVKSFLMFDRLAESQRRDPLRIAYCAYHGAGRKAVPRLLTESGFHDINIIHENSLYDLNGLFPSFPSDPGKERQPDPGDDRAARTAIDAYVKEYGNFDDRELFIGTDPDADRCGVVVHVPENQRRLYGGQDWTLLPADSVWAVLLWYRFQQEAAKYGSVQHADRKFIVLSHTTSEALIRLATKYGLGSIKTWVGFAALSASIRDVWEKKPLPNLVEGRRSPGDAFCHPFVCEYYGMDSTRRSINVAAMEQSNGFSLLGGPPPDNRSLGAEGHVRDKDGTLAALLVAEIAAWAKDQGTTLFELIDRHVYLDPDVGLFVTHYEPDPLDGEYPGIEGDRKKKAILQKALDLYHAAGSRKVQIAGQAVTGTALYRTGKYDAIYPPEGNFVFPDEGVRFYFGDKLNHLTVRPSGTGNSLRFHVQLQSPVNENNLIERKRNLMERAKAITDDIRELVGAPRE
jgi:phosphoglucomutase